MESAVDEYFSDSTIDNPPREPKEPKQDGLFADEAHEKTVEDFLSVNTPAAFEFKLTLALKATEGNTNIITIPVAAGKAPSEMIEQLMDKTFQSERFRKILRSIIGDPFVEEKKEEN